MTTMFDRFFGVPQAVLRSGTWAKMKPTEQSLYICLLHESERYRTRELRRTDAQLGDLSALSSRSFCNARKKLQERRLVLYRRAVGNAYVYTLCNPETGEPWPGDPKHRVPYIKKSQSGPTLDGNVRDKSSTVSPDTESELERHGVPVSF